jgi:2-polyprenyl-6-methoxyphenol hydroxylase-like FAD-dependent oxidoreductase
MIPDRTKVLIVGGGPCGLMLANELGRRDVAAVVIDQKPSTAFSPQANTTQARTMEHYRWLGFANEVRALGLPKNYPTDIAYFTRYSGYEITRLAMPASSEATKLIKSMGGSWGAAEMPHRVPQKFVERVLLRHASELPARRRRPMRRRSTCRPAIRAGAPRTFGCLTGDPCLMHLASNGRCCGLGQDGARLSRSSGRHALSIST